MKYSKDTLYINSPHRPAIKSKNLQPNIPIKYLRLISQVNREQATQTNELFAKVKKISRNLCYSHFSYCLGDTYQQYVSNSRLSYPLVASSRIDKEINEIQKIINPQIIVSKEFNRYWPTELRYGKHQCSGLAMMDLSAEQRVRKLKFFKKMLLHHKHKI